MEPKLPAPNLGPEHNPSYEQNAEADKPSIERMEAGIERGAERMEQRGETTAPKLATVPVAPTLPPPVVVSATSDDTAIDNNPLVADDADLIEKEWVDKAKQIILQTKDDPHRREQEVGKLQADYLLKRYGKELGASK